MATDSPRIAIPATLTLAGASAALLSAVAWLDGAHADAALLFFAAVALDQLDGPVARALGATSRRGAALDALADLLIYAVVPASLLIPAGPLGVTGALLAFVPLAWRLSGDLTRDVKGPHFGLPSVLLVCATTLWGAPPGPVVALLAGGAMALWTLLIPRVPGWMRFPVGALAAVSLGVALMG